MNVRFVMEGKDEKDSVPKKIVPALESNFKAMIESLQPEQMVIDQVIDLYCKELERRYPFPNTRILHSQFFTFLPHRKQKYFKNNELSTLHFLFFPIFDDQMNHWRLAIVELLRRFENSVRNLYLTVSVIDSVPIHPEHARNIAFSLSRFIANESDGQFANVYCEFNRPICPRQTNSHDCGLYTMFFIREWRRHLFHTLYKQIQSKERTSILQDCPIEYSLDHFVDRENTILFVQNTFTALQQANVSGTDLDPDLQELLDSIEENKEKDDKKQEARQENEKE